MVMFQHLTVAESKFVVHLLLNLHMATQNCSVVAKEVPPREIRTSVIVVVMGSTTKLA